MIKSEPVRQMQSPLVVVRGLLLILSFFGGAFGAFFFIWKQNFIASSTCVILELVCVVLLHLTTAVMKGKLHEKYNETRLKFIFILSIVIGVAEIVSSLLYAALGTVNKQGFVIEGYGYYVAIIPSSLAVIWSFVLAYESRTLMRQFTTGPTNMAQF